MVISFLIFILFLAKFERELLIKSKEISVLLEGNMNSPQGQPVDWRVLEGEPEALGHLAAVRLRLDDLEEGVLGRLPDFWKKESFFPHYKYIKNIYKFLLSKRVF